MCVCVCVCVCVCSTFFSFFFIYIIFFVNCFGRTMQRKNSFWVNMYHVSARGVDERMINVYYYLLYLFASDI